MKLISDNAYLVKPCGDQECPDDVRQALYALRPPIDGSGAAFYYWDGQVTYADIGKGRGKLDMEWIERVRKGIVECQEFEELGRRAIESARQRGKTSEGQR